MTPPAICPLFSIPARFLPSSSLVWRQIEMASSLLLLCTPSKGSYGAPSILVLLLPCCLGGRLEPTSCLPWSMRLLLSFFLSLSCLFSLPFSLFSPSWAFLYLHILLPLGKNWEEISEGYNWFLFFHFNASLSWKSICKNSNKRYCRYCH